MTLINCLSWNLPLITSPCTSCILYVGGLRVAIATFLKISFVSCGLYPFLNGKSCLEIRTRYPTWNFGLLKSLISLLYSTDIKSVFIIARLHIYWFIPSRIQRCNKLRQLGKILVSIVFNVAVQNTFQWTNSSLGECCLCFTHYWINLCPFSAAKLFKFTSKLFFFVNPNLLWSFPLYNHLRKSSKCLLRVLCFQSSHVYCFVKHVLVNLQVLYSSVILCQCKNICQVHTPYLILVSSKCSHAFKLACCKCKFCLRVFWM